jgi:hypothetical protein
MVQVTVCDQNPVQAFKPQPGFQDLALSALTAIDEKTEFFVFYDLGS